MDNIKEKIKERSTTFLKTGGKTLLRTGWDIFLKAVSILGMTGSGFLGIIGVMTAITLLICSSVATFPLTEEGLDIQATGQGVDLTYTGGTAKQEGEAGARYEWNELAKAELVSNNYEKNLYKLCMLFYQALSDTGQTTGDKSVRMDSLLATGSVESGMKFFIGAEDSGDILTDLVTANSSGGQYKGTFACSESEVQKYQWERYTPKGNPLYLPDSVYFLVNEAKSTYESILKVSDDPRGHQYGKYLQSAFSEFGLNWEDTKAKNDVCAMLYYLKHAGGNWNDDWCYAMTRYIVYMYTTYLEKDFKNLVVTNFDNLGSATLQGYAIGTNTVYGFTMTKDNLTNIVGKKRGKGVTIPSMFKYKGEEVVDSFAALYFFNAPKGAEDLEIFNSYADDVYDNGEYGVKSQAVMALLMGVPYASVGQGYMLKAIQSLGYTEEDFTIDEYGYLCYTKNTGTDDVKSEENTSTGTCVLNAETIKYVGQVIAAEATDSQDLTDKKALAEAEAVAVTIYNRMMEFYLKSNDYNDAALAAITASGQFSTVFLGDGTNSFTYKGRTYHTSRTSTPLTDLAIKEIFKADVNDSERQTAFHNIQVNMGNNPSITDIERIYYFLSERCGYSTYGEIHVGQMGNCYSYSSKTKYSWLE